MKYREMIPDVIEAVNYVPRNYVLTWLRPGTNNKIAFGPSYEMKANILRTFWPKLAKRITEWPQYKKGHGEYTVLGRHMPALFKPPAELLGAEDPAETFREKVRQREGTYITDVTPGQAVISIARRGSVLNGRVKSKSGSAHYDVAVRNVYLTPEGDIDIYAVVCGCREHTESMGKGHKYVTFVFDVHPTALVNEAVSRRKNPTHLRKPVTGKGRYSEAEFFHPFNFATNWIGERGQISPISQDMAMLELDMAAEYYFQGATYDEINRKVFRTPVYSDPLIRAAAKGECSYELLKHGSERREEKDRPLVEAEKHMLKQIYANILPLGYQYECTCLELGRPAIRFESKDNVLDFVPGRVQKDKYRLPFYVIRPKTAGKMTLEDMCSAYEEDKSPFGQMNIDGKPLEILDDHTKQRTPAIIRPATTLIVPELGNRTTEIEVPKQFEKMYRSMIEKFSPDARRDLKKARLFYDRQ